jgi:hypothetical protein
VGLAVVFDAETELLIVRSARIALQFTRRHPAYDIEELRQVGRLAIVEAFAEDRVPEDPAHRANYISRRALGAMQDYIRKEWHEHIGLSRNGRSATTYALVEGIEFDLADRPDVGDASTYSHILRALQYVASKLKPNGQTFIEGLLAGNSTAEAMDRAGVASWNRTKYRYRFFQLLGRWL